MTLFERIQEDMKTAMRSGEALRRDTLRMAITALKNRRIELGEDLSETEELAVLTKAVKSRSDSVDQYTQAGREDLADKERAEIEVLRTYLPEQLNEDEARAVVQRVIADLGLTEKKDLGRLMKSVMAEYKGRIEGKLVQKLAAELLA